MRTKAPRSIKPLLLAICSGILGIYLVSPIFGVLLAGLIWFWMRARRKHLLANKEAKQNQIAIQNELPDIVDLFAISLSSGLTIRLALEAVVEGIQGEIWPNSKQIFSKVLASARLGKPLAEALSSVPRSFFELTTPLIESERYGTELLPTLQRVSANIRASNLRKAEIAARKIPVKLLFPLVICILPAFGFLTLAPVFISSLQTITQ